MVTKFGAVTLLVAISLTAWSLRSAGAGPAVAIASNVVVSGATPEQLDLARWAVGRFETAGLQTPVVEIRFHTDASGCDGYLGYAEAGRVDLCTTLVNEMATRALLHEMGHIWIDQNVSPEGRERFLELRGLSSWNASPADWADRGYEQAAEIMAWGLGNRILTAQIPDNDPTDLATGFRLLTGLAPLGHIETEAEHTLSTHKGVVRIGPLP